MLRRSLPGYLMVCIMVAVSACSPAGGTIPPAGPSPTATVTTIPTVSPTPYIPPKHQIAIREINGAGEFYDTLTGDKFIPRGMNYIRIGPQTNPYGESTTYHAVFDPGKYDPQRVDTALARMSVDGYNLVRVFLSQNTIGTASDGLSFTYLQNIADFLVRAKQNHIYVMFTQDWLPAGKYDTIIGRDCCTNFNLMNLNYLSSGGLEANVAFFEDFVQGLLNLRAPMDVIFSFELRNEMFYETNQTSAFADPGKNNCGEWKNL